MQHRRLRSAMVVASPFPANHGTPGSTRELADAVARQGVDVHVVTYHFGQGADPKECRVHRIPGYRFSTKVVVGPTKEKPILDLLMVKKLCSVIAKERIDVIHGHNYEGALVGYLGKLWTGRPLVYQAINTMKDELASYDFFRVKAVAHGLAKVLDAVVPRLGDRVICISRELVDLLKAEGVDAARMEHIPLGLDFSPFEKYRGEQEARRADRPRVIYTGILDRFQRIDYLIRAMRVVVDAVPEAELLLVVNIAREEDIRSCEAQVTDLGLASSVRIVRSSSFEEIPAHLAQADVAVVCRPSCPGFPLKLLNYMAAGKPIVAFDGSAKGLEDGKDARLVRDHDWKGLAQGIIGLLKDRDLASRLGRGALETVQSQYSWDNIAKRIVNTYEKALGR